MTAYNDSLTTSPAHHDTNIEAVAAHVQAQFLAESSGHDWQHIRRLWRLARQIGVDEGADLEIVELAALLHDIADWKSHDGDDRACTYIWPVFSHLRGQQHLDRFRRRGLSAVKREFALHVMAHNFVTNGGPARRRD